MTARHGRKPAAVPSAVRAVLFDLDDTLYPERQFVDGGFRAVARFLGQRVGRSEDSIADRLWALHTRDGRGRLFDSLLAELGLDDDPDLVVACLLVYRTQRTRLEPFPGVEPTLRELRAGGIATGLVSDGLSAVQRRKLAGLGAVPDLLDVVVMTDELGPGHAKPSPVPFRVSCRLLDVPPSLAVYVGNDPRKDFSGARDAGLYTIRFGPFPDEGGATPLEVATAGDADLTIDSIGELASLFSGAATPIDARPAVTT